VAYILPLADDSFGDEEKHAMISVIESGHYTMGEKVAEFEDAFSYWLGSSHSVMVNSGSSANLLLVYSQIVSSFKNDLMKPGDEVLVPALLWPTTIWPLIQFGLKPVLVDIDLESLAMDLEDSQCKVTKKTKAVFLIHVLGYACEMNDYVSFCQDHNLILLEDCCESFGAFDKERSVGTFGVGGTFSHFFSHHLTTMEGGTITTNSLELADDLKSMRAHGWVRNRTDIDTISSKYPELDKRFLFLMPGFNVRPMEIQAAVGLVQLKRIDELLSYRDYFAKHVIDTFHQIDWLRIAGSKRTNIGVERQKRDHSWMNISFILNEDCPVTLQEVVNIFETSGVETRPIITGNFANQPAASYIANITSYPNAQILTDQGFMIGCHATKISDLLAETMDLISNQLKEL
jgi:CDP-6-deoxy-D-xylo-4-hexulose-3-dehydrase